jgi:hypothetical protein
MIIIFSSCREVVMRFVLLDETYSKLVLGARPTEVGRMSSLSVTSRLAMMEVDAGGGLRTNYYISNLSHRH